MKGIGIVKKLSKTLPWHSLVTIYESFVRSHMGYVDVIYHQPISESILQKIETIEYNATLAIAGLKKGTPQRKLCIELGVKVRKFRRSFWEL